MSRIVFAVLTGYITAVTLAFFTGIASVFAGSKPDAFFWVALITELPWGLAGGYIAARIADKSEKAATLGLVALSAALGIIALAFGGVDRTLVWRSMATLALLVMGELAGGYLRIRQTNKLVG